MRKNVDGRKFANLPRECSPRSPSATNLLFSSKEMLWLSRKAIHGRVIMMIVIFSHNEDAESAAPLVRRPLIGNRVSGDFEVD